ncbi:unnamed protein product [Owenia fusiformis]|uniref:Double zinc ribbon and ankyrin repeat-containing protein 1 n=1 Tax=Owenia fusiformis TaxID=6347 RepID=A0A8J1XXQ4_OWEFU|nr:unnamed protein product [Owenia fusiformis]
MTAGSIAVPTIVPLRAPIPGQHKTAIDSNTRIEIASETHGVTVFYTTNGSKPEPFQKVGPRNTYKYREPFTLPGGKRIVKAVAVENDGLRESNIVTKTFEVEYIEPDPPPRVDDEHGFVNELNRERRKGKRGTDKSLMSQLLTAKEAWEDVQNHKEMENRMAEMKVNGSNRHRPTNKARFTQSRLGYPDASDKATVGQHSIRDNMTVNGATDLDHLDYPERRRPPDSATQALRLQRETDFLKCIYCYAPRPADPYARFCNECGSPIPPLPQTRLPPPEAGQMGMCVFCKSMVPFNTPQCLICEAPIPAQNQPQASIKLDDKLLCVVCGTANPSNLVTCVTCESKLPTQAKPIFSGQSAPPMPSQDGRLLTCTKCRRVNNSDARYCDWCGAKPSPAARHLICSKCKASNGPYAQFCGTCGVILEPPRRIDPRNSGMAVNMAGDGKVDAQWLPVTVTLPQDIPRCDTSTQTVGLFFPSGREITKREVEEEERLAQEKLARDRKPLLTSVSPGKGYWRKQMEHICTHLKAHAQNDAEFRALVGEPRMGKLLTTAVHEDGYELSLTVNFALRGNQDPFKGKNLGMSKGEYLSAYTEGRRGSVGSFASMDSLASEENSPNKKTKKKVKKVKKKVEDKQSPDDKRLLKEVGKNGEGSPEEVQQLIDEGADPNCTNKNGVPVLHVAVMNKHIDAIPVIVQAGADVNTKGPNRGNSALHEAVTLGHDGRDVIDTLLGCGASLKKKNEKGETAYDLASKAGHDSIIKQLASNMGQSALDKMIAPKSHEIETF